jgi:uncharacterized protein (DUF488 family)
MTLVVLPRNAKILPLNDAANRVQWRPEPKAWRSILAKRLWTIGYSGYLLEDFVQALQRNKVKCLVDIREIPISRKRGFSKSALSEAVSHVGIEYRHFRVLGSPRRDRHRLRDTDDYKTFFRRMTIHLARSEAVEGIDEVVRVAREQTSCLMCCCPDWQHCHRKVVVEAIRNLTSFTFVHLGATDGHVTSKAA